MNKGVEVKGNTMDNETIKKKWLEILTRIFREDWMDDDDFSEFTDEVMDLAGGWGKLYKDIQVGIDNGLTVEQQFAICEKIIINGTQGI